MLSARRPLRERSVTLRTLALAIALFTVFALTACQTPATYVMVMVDTDDASRVMSMRAVMSRGTSISAMPTVHAWTRTSDSNDIHFPGTFTLVPGTGPNDGTVTLQVELVFLPSAAGQPLVTVRRTARFHFTPHQQTYIRLFLPASCAAEVVAPAHCANTTTPCTVSRYCEEQGNQTCGDDGRCVMVDITPLQILGDSGLLGGDSAHHDASDAATDVSRDGPAPDVVTDTGCTPNCTGRVCGTDGCSGTCGTCPTGMGCDPSGHCFAGCTANCTGRMCGDDGCGGLCGACTGGQECNTSGQCVCVPNCTGRACGPDGCGGTCGSCASGQSCDGAGQCVCVPNCAGRSCGNDGCGGTCGSCGGGLVCNGAGQCVSSCTPSCAGRSCGSDGCSGSCGSCGGGQMCNGSGQCVCSPNCAGRACGSDSCGGSCGSCGGGYVCNGSSCVACSAGAGCSTGNPCQNGTTDCSSGSPVCNFAGNVGAGSGCPGGVCNGSGSCVSCSAGAGCSTGNPCTSGTIDCSSGGPVCNATANAGAGTPCPGGVCNGSGSCVACAQGMACSSFNECVTAAAIDCSSGGPVCTPTAFAANGAYCSSPLDNSQCDGAGNCRCVPRSGGPWCNRCGICQFSCSLACP